MSKLLTLMLLLSSTSFALESLPLDITILNRSSLELVEITYEELRQYHTGNVHIDTAFNLAYLHLGTPYVWAGYNWDDGVDCSHFTWMLYRDALSDYKLYMTTYTLKKVVKYNGLEQVDEIKAGDLLVYGYHDENGWHGHVVIAVNPKDGLVVGSNWPRGVEFVKYEGYPDYYRVPENTLKRILRLQSNN